MDWQLPDISIILATLIIIFLIFLRVGRHLEVRETFFQLWVLAWLLSIVHYLGQLGWLVGHHVWGYLLNDLFLGYSAIAFAAASQSLRGSRLRTMMPYIAITASVFSVWAYLDTYGTGIWEKVLRYAPYSVALGATFGTAGVLLWLHHRKQSTIGGAILSYTFLFWGLSFVCFALFGASQLFTDYAAYAYQFSNLPKPVAAIGMLIFLIECQKVNAQRQRDFVESLIEDAPDGIFMLDPSQTLIRVNKRFEAICGRPANELLGNPLARFVRPGEMQTPGADGIQVDHGGDHYQANVLTKEGKSRAVLITSKPIQSPSSVVGSMGIVKDVTDRLQLEQQLRQSEKMASIGLMVSGVAHELNNPLTSVIGFTELALREPSIPGPTADRLQVVLSEARRTRSIVHRLLSAVRQQRSERLPTILNQIINDTIALRENDFGLNNIELIADLDPDTPIVMANASDLQQVLINLMQNAFDAVRENPAGGHVTIRSRYTGSEAIVEVIDDGPGIAEPTKVFDPFYTTKEVGKGTGLGLSICYQIIKSQGGEITVQNLPVGVKFTIRLRGWEGGAPKQQAEESRKAVEPGKGRAGKVLVVDDEPVILAFCEEILSSAGFSVETSTNGADAIQKLSDSSYDVIVTDFRMPGKVSGADLYNWVCQNQSGCQSRIIFMTGDSVNPSTYSFLRSTGNHVVFKPFEPDELVKRVKDLVSALSAEP
ncbi:MAG TPA: response regulator [Blastocatellia bacterium]|nr:response regulator [Blastocatellia bacterium]